MRIVHVTADPGVPVFGTKGASVHVQEVVRAFRRLGHDVEIVTARPGGPPPADLRDVTVHRIDAGEHDGTDREREAARREAGRRSADVLDRLGAIDLVYERYSLWGSAGMAWARRVGVPGVLEVNAPLPDEHATHRRLHDRDAADAVAAGAIAAATTVIAVSEPVRRWAVSAVRSDLRAEVADRSYVVPNGVDTDRIRPVAAARPPDEPVTIGFVGTLKPWHGLDTLGAAMGELRRRRPCRLLVVGDGPEREGLVRRAGDAGVVIELTGAVDPSTIPSLLARMDIAVAPYPATATYFSPLKLVEYMAAGLPIVASDVGSVSDVIDHDVTGVLVTPGDAVALGAALDRVAADEPLRATLGARARRRAVDRHTWRSAATRILDLATEHTAVA